MLYSYHRGQYLQRGRGIGGLFASLFRWLKPIIPTIFKAGKKALKDPAVSTALKSVKNEAIAASTRAVNKGLKNIAPPSTAKKPVKMKQPKPKTAVPKGAKRVVTSLKSNVIPKKLKKNENSSIFDDMK